MQVTHSANKHFASSFVDLDFRGMGWGEDFKRVAEVKDEGPPELRNIVLNRLAYTEAATCFHTT